MFIKNIKLNLVFILILVLVFVSVHYSNSNKKEILQSKLAKEKTFDFYNLSKEDIIFYQQGKVLKNSLPLAIYYNQETPANKSKYDSYITLYKNTKENKYYFVTLYTNKKASLSNLKLFNTQHNNIIKFVEYVPNGYNGDDFGEYILFNKINFELKKLNKEGNVYLALKALYTFN